MKINGSVYVDENQLTAELEKLNAGKISEILLLRSVKQNSYMKLSMEDGYYDFCFSKESDFNTIKLPLSEYDNVVKALKCYCNKDGKYRKIFNWQKSEQEKNDSLLVVEKDSPNELDKSSTPENINKRLSFGECFTVTLMKNYCNFSGRESRRTYWFYTLFVTLLSTIFWLGALITENPIFLVIFAIMSIAFLLPSLAISIRRLHDINKSGWYLLLGFVPYIGSFILLYFFIKEGTNGENDYGYPAD